MLKYLLALACIASIAHAEPRDGSHDFDFELGKWKIKVRRLDHPLSGEPAKWTEWSGSSQTRSVWDGKAQLAEIAIDSPAGGHLQGLTLRMYSGHQWFLYWANVKTPRFDVPTVGEFNGKGDRGEFYDQEMYEGRMILVRFVWSNVKTNVPHFEQAFSVDGGKTWETNWITDQTRIE